MADPQEALGARAGRYATARGMALEYSLGFGKDGSVFSSSVLTAVKAFEDVEKYGRERDVYLRLAERGFVEVLGHRIPRMIAWSDRLMVIEMTIVRPPYLLDFASARLDEGMDFSEEVMAEWHRAREEEFGGNWGKVLVMMEILWRECGVVLTDVHPRNVAF